MAAERSEWVRLGRGGHPELLLPAGGDRCQSLCSRRDRAPAGADRQRAAERDLTRKAVHPAEGERSAFSIFPKRRFCGIMEPDGPACRVGRGSETKGALVYGKNAAQLRGSDRGSQHPGGSAGRGGPPCAEGFSPGRAHGAGGRRKSRMADGKGGK